MSARVINCHQCEKSCAVHETGIAGKNKHGFTVYADDYYSICGSGSIKKMKNGDVVHVDCIKPYIEELQEKDCIKTITQ